MKQPTKQEITKKINDVIMKRISREDVSEWANEYDIAKFIEEYQ